MSISILLACISIIIVRIFWYIFVMGLGRYGRIARDMPESFRKTNTLSNRIRAFLRRRNVLNLKKRFVYIDGNVITLKNKYVSLVFDTFNKTFNCVDNMDKCRISTVVWHEQPFSFKEKYDNFFEQTFDNICFAFNDDANYQGILEYLKQNFIVQETQNNKNKRVLKNYVLSKFMQENKDLININTATEDELSKLPGVTLIVAKKIIKYRDLHRGFKSKEEFYSKMNIKPHFQKQIDSAIVLIGGNIKDKNQDERIVDF